MRSLFFHISKYYCQQIVLQLWINYCLDCYFDFFFDSVNWMSNLGFTELFLNLHWLLKERKAIIDINGRGHLAACVFTARFPNRMDYCGGEDD